VSSCLLCGLPLAPNVTNGSVPVFSITGGSLVTVIVTVTTGTGVGVQECHGVVLTVVDGGGGVGVTSSVREALPRE